MTAFSQTEIANLALREIGTYRLDDFATDASPEADVMRDLWNMAVRRTLARHEWRFAIKGAGPLVSTGVTPKTRYAYAYTLPGDFVRLSTVGDRSDMEPPLTEWDIVNGDLCANSTSVYIEYVYDAPNISVWPPWFVDVLVADLASLAASPLKSTTERERLEKLAMDRLAMGRSVASTQQPSRPHRGGSWIWAARGYRVR